MKTLTNLGALLTVIPLVVTLSGCQSETQPAGETDMRSSLPVNSDSQPEVPLPDLSPDKPDTGITSQIINLPPDHDEDGIPDESDPWPYDSPELSGSGGPDFTVAISRSTTHGEVLIENTLVSGAQVSIDITAENNGEPLWIQWRGEGLTIAVPAQYGRNDLEAPEIKVNQIAVIRGQTISYATPVAGYYPGEPWIYPISEPIFTGTEVALDGDNLNSISNLKLGNKLLDSTITDQGSLLLTIPSLPSSAVLNWTSSGATEYRNSIKLPLRRTVTLAAGNEIHGKGWSYLGQTLSDTAEIVVAAGEPTTFYLTHPSHAINVSAVIWPDQQEVIFGTASTIEHWMYRLLRISGLAQGSWLKDREFLPEPSDFSYLQDMLINDLSDRTITASNAMKNIDPGRVQWNKPDPTYQAATYPAGFVPLYAQSVSLISPDYAPKDSTNFIGLQHYGDTTGCWGVEGITKPKGLLSSDICVSNSGGAFLSISVKDKNGRILRSHISGRGIAQKWAHKDILGPGWMTLPSPKAYLTTDAGAPLCHMKECTVEILTGGWSKVSGLTSKEKEAVKVLYWRTIVESMLLDTLAAILGGPTSTKQCVADIALGSGQLFVKLVGQTTTLNNKLKAANTDDEGRLIILEFMAAIALDEMKGKLAEIASGRAAPPASCTDYFNGVKTATSQVTNAFIATKAATLVSQFIKNLSVGLTPEKIAFKVKPRTSIDSVTVIGDSYLRPDQTDTALKISGCHISNQIIDGTGQPDPRYNYWPELTLTDSKGNSKKLILQPGTPAANDPADRITLTQAPNSLCESSYTLPIAVLKDKMSPLKYGKIKADLVIENSDQFSTTFPGSELPVPGAHFDWRGPPRLTGVENGVLFANGVNILSGENLTALKGRALKATLVSALNNTRYIELSNTRYLDSGKLEVTLPFLVLPGAYDLTVQEISGSSNPAVMQLNNISVASSTTSAITLSDRGPLIDDHMIVDIYDTELDLQSNGLQLIQELKAGKNSVTMTFDSTTMLTSNGTEPKMPVTIFVNCVDGSIDNLCTWDVRGILHSKDGLSSKEFSASGKAPEGDIVEAITINFP